VINDSSTDSTKAVLRQNGVEFLDLPVNLGIGGGVQAGYLYAYENDYDSAVQMDGDGQHCAEELEKLIAPIESDSVNVVIGSRFIDKEGFQSSQMRRVGITILSKLIRLCTGLRVRDVTSGFRAVNRKFIEIFSRLYAWDYPEPEAIVTVAKEEGKMIEVPVVMRERTSGKSSISIKNSVSFILLYKYRKSGFLDL
jgi:Predicted glycosyltransferases